MANTNPIGFLDSGVGLISVLKETKKLLPKENYVIFADQGHNPYGEKTSNQIKKFAANATEFLIKHHHIKMMILACNTATVLALAYLRKHFDIPFIGVVPAVKPAFLKSKNGRVAVMSTPATAKSDYLKKLIKNHSGGTVLRLGCSGLEEAVEVLDWQKIDKILDKYVAKIKKFDADVIVLGCTHYPLIKNQIQKKLDPQIQIIDSGRAIAKRAKELLLKKGIQSNTRTHDFYYTSGNPQLFSKVVSTLMKSQVHALKASN